MSFSIGADVPEGGSLEVLDNSLGTSMPPDENGVMMWILKESFTITNGLGQEVGTINSWENQLKPDPFVTNNINITNTTAGNVVYIASVVLPIPAFNYNRVINSSVGITATDSNNDGDLLVDVDGPTLYRGRVDGVTKLSLTPPDVPITTADCPTTFDGCTATDSIGVASLASVGTATEIEIILRFVLSPGDSVGITSRFEIVPEPTTGLLLGLGVAAMAVARRRR